MTFLGGEMVLAVFLIGENNGSGGGEMALGDVVCGEMVLGVFQVGDDLQYTGCFSNGLDEQAP